MDLALFHVDEPPPVEKLSEGRRLTQRQHADIAAGIHPLTRGKARPELGTCGDCAHRQMLSAYSGKGYPKCLGYGQRYVANSVTSDVRAFWPACGQFTPSTEDSAP